MNSNEIKWADIAFGSKKVLRDLNATFIAAPRQISVARMTQLVREYLPLGNIVVGCADELYVAGFENQAQFMTLQADTIRQLVEKVNNSPSPHKITILHYKQTDIVAIYNKIKFRQVLLVNGSWLYSFHTRPEYYALVSQAVPFRYISAFTDEAEALDFAAKFKPRMIEYGVKLSELEMMNTASLAAVNSFDNAFQTGLSLGEKSGNKYKLITTEYNQVVPYSTFAWHFGAQRERHMSVPGDLNHYDAVHAETMLLVQAQKAGLSLKNTTLFINLLPCPTCARMLATTDIAEFVYSLDHSDGYAVSLLEKAGKVVRRVVNANDIVEAETGV